MGITTTERSEVAGENKERLGRRNEAKASFFAFYEVNHQLSFVRYWLRKLESQ